MDGGGGGYVATQSGDEACALEGVLAHGCTHTGHVQGSDEPSVNDDGTAMLQDPITTVCEARGSE